MIPRRCPRCRSLPCLYTEVWAGHSIEFEAQSDGRPEANGELIGVGDPEYVLATCRCGHQWKLRGVSQITGLKQKELL